MTGHGSIEVAGVTYKVEMAYNHGYAGALVGTLCDDPDCEWPIFDQMAHNVIHHGYRP